MSGKESLRAQLAPLLPPNARTVILGVGSELRRDDFAGAYLARLVAKRADAEHLLAVDGSTAPENCTGLIRAFRPDAVIVVDAARMNASPGEYALLDEREITGATFSTHMLPLPFTLSYLTAACGCAVAYVGVEPASTELGIGMDERVRLGVERLAAELLGP